MLSASQVLAACAIGAAAAVLTYFGGLALYVHLAWHFERLDAEVDALFPADRPRDH